MNPHTLRLLVPVAALVWAFHATAAVNGPVKVEYQKPEEFTDVKERNAKTPPDKNQHLIELKRWLETEASKYLQPGQQLQIVINDIDLAGDYTPGSNAASSDIRVIKDLYPPAMKLSFTLKAADGAVLNSGERQLRDMGYLMSSSPSSRTSSLEYDKAMMKRWLRNEFPTDM